MKLGITLSLDGGVIFDASPYADVIRRSHSGGSAMAPAFDPCNVLSPSMVVDYAYCSKVNIKGYDWHNLMDAVSSEGGTH